MFKMLKLLAARLLDADTKVLVKAGYISECLELTEKGQRILLTILLTDEAIKGKMVAQANEYLAQKKDEAEA